MLLSTVAAHETRAVPGRGFLFETPGWKIRLYLMRDFKCQLGSKPHLHAFEAPSIPGTLLLRLLLLLLLRLLLLVLLLLLVP